jgi:glucose/arabinose dehydrogenase
MTKLSPMGAPRVALTALCLALGAMAAMPAQAATEKVAKTPATAATAKAQARPSQPRPAKPYTIEQFMATTSVRGASFSQDERRILFSSNATGIFNVYSQSVTAASRWR